MSFSQTSSTNGISLNTIQNNNISTSITSPNNVHFTYEQLKHNFNWFFQLKDAALATEFASYNQKQRSRGFLLYSILVYSFLLTPNVIYVFFTDLSVGGSNLNGNEIYLAAAHVLICVTATIAGWRLYIQQRYRSEFITLPSTAHDNGTANEEEIVDEEMCTSRPDQPKTFKSYSNYKAIAKSNQAQNKENPTLFSSMRDTLQRWYQACCSWNLTNGVFILASQWIFLFSFLRRAFTSQMCAQTNTDYFGSKFCQPVDDFPEYFLGSAMIIIFIPVLCFANIPDTSIEIIWISYFINLITFVVTAIVKGFEGTLLTGIALFLSVLFTIVDIQVRNVIIFLTNRELQEILAMNERNADEVHATEMRHMIANVAHDLKTPLASFITGIDIIQLAMDECLDQMAVKRSHTTVIKEAFESIQNCVSNIRNTNTFMLMTINRCIDYTKASKGMKLTPQYETIDLIETLQLPLQCMSNIQHRIGINLLDFPSNICSHIMTDKQWLQENLLCLLSNAVKYSSDGEVTITVRIEEVAKNASRPQTPRDQNDDVSVLSSPSVCESNEADSDVPKWSPLKNHQNVTSSSEAALPSTDDLPLYVFYTGAMIPAKSPAELRSTIDVASSNVTSVSVQDKIEPLRVPKLDIESSFRDADSVFSSRTVLQLYLRIEVEDTGIGMTEEAMIALFSPFKQTQRLAGGTGLGLYSLAKRVEALHGYYGVQGRNDMKQGTLFWFMIPYKPDEVTAELTKTFADAVPPSPLHHLNASPPLQSRREGGRGDLARSPEDDKEHEQSSPSQTTMTRLNPFQGDLHIHIPVPEFFPQTSLRLKVSPKPIKASEKALRFLIVDDSPAILKMTSMMLKKLGHSITTAENGEVAVNLLMQAGSASEEKAFDFILIDLQMPVMDGLEATKRIRKLESGQFVTPKHSLQGAMRVLPKHFVIGMSANSDDETVQLAYHAGVDTFIAKPFKLTTLNELLDKYGNF